MMRSDVDAVRALLADQDPAAAGPPYLAAGTPVERVFARIDAAVPVAPVGRRRPRRLVLIGGAVTVFAVVVDVSGLVGGRLTIDPAAAAAVRRTGQAALAAPDPGEFTTGRFWYVRRLAQSRRTVAVDGGDSDYTLQYTTVRESWAGADGSGRRRTRLVGQPRFVSAEDERRWRAHGSPTRIFQLLADEDTRSGPDPGALTGYRRLTALPTDPTALFDHFEREAHGHSDGTFQQMFTLVSDALGEQWPMRPPLRAALYEVLARIPGVRVINGVTDLAGRPSTAAVMATTDLLGAFQVREEIFYDPATGQPRGNRMLVSRNLTPLGDPEGTIMTYDTIDVQGFTDSTDNTHPQR